MKIFHASDYVFYRFKEAAKSFCVHHYMTMSMYSTPGLQKRSKGRKLCKSDFQIYYMPHLKVFEIYNLVKLKDIVFPLFVVKVSG